MSGRPRFLESLVLGGSAFILTQAILSLMFALEPGDPPGEGNPTWRLILSVSYLSVVVILLLHYRETLFVLRRNGFLVALVLLALASCSWAATPALVLRRAIAVLGTTLFGIALAVRLSLEDQLRLMSWLFRIIAVLSLACILLLPSYGISSGVEDHGEWRGIFSHKNGLGFAMALSVFVEWQLPAQTRFSKVLKRFALLLSAVSLFFSGSMTPVFALVGSLLLTGIFKLSQRLRIPLYAIVLATSLMIASGVTAFLLDSERITAALGRSADLTGRTEIWRLVIPYILERPILGYGYSGFWWGLSPQSIAIDQVLGTRIQYSHNGFLEILLTLGAVGFLLVLAFLGTGIKRAYYCSERNQSSIGHWPLTFLLFFILHNVGECTILYQDLEWALCVAAIVSADAALSAPDAEQEDELPLVPSEEFT
jgi:exopolysaccharide production protein ExoQ